MVRGISSEVRVDSLIEALPYIQKFRGKTFVIKYGGSAMEDEYVVEKLLRDIVFLEAVGINPVLVHGGGKAISSKMRAAGLTPRFVNGMRVTDAKSISIVQETLDNEINPQICEALDRLGGRSYGVSGGKVFVAEKMRPQVQGDGSAVDIGFVGDVSGVDVMEVRAAIEREMVPVISPVGADHGGTVLNINADLAAAGLAAALKASKLIFISDVLGIMRDPSEPESLIPTVTSAQTKLLVDEEVIHGGMLPKVEAAVRALERGVGKVHLLGGQIPHCLLLEIFTNRGIGTEIVR